MKKILIINTTIHKGGAARVAKELFETQADGLDIHFAYGRQADVSDKNAFHFGNKIEMLADILLVRFLGLEGSANYFSTRKLITHIKKEGFDLINLHNLHGYYLNFSMLLTFLAKAGIPVLYSLHDEWPITWLPAHSLGCNHCKTGKGKCTNTYAYPKSYFPLFTKFMLSKKRRLLSNIPNMTILCPSNWLANNIKESFLGSNPIEVVHNGIDTKTFAPHDDKAALRIKHSLPVDKKIVLFSASDLNDPSKGANHIIEAADMLKDKDYHFVAMGKGSIKERDNVQATGYIYDKDKLAETYALSDVFCFASAAETFLLSAAEALSCGVPVVGFDLPVVRELVSKDVGILTSHNASSLAAGIESLFDGTRDTIAMGQAGRELIAGQYSKERFRSQYADLYRKLSR